MGKVEEERDECFRELPKAHFALLKNQRDKALDLICELIEDDPSFVCEELHEIEEEYRICEHNCKEFGHKCILRYLKYYEKGDLCYENT